MRASLLAPAQSLQALSEGVVRVRRGRIELEDALERGAGGLVLTGVEVGPPERLEDGRLARLEPIGSLQHDRRLRVMARSEQRLTALEQLVGRFVLRRVVGSPLIHDLILARPAGVGR